MKLLFGMLITILLISSCGKDDNTVLGKWKTDSLALKTIAQDKICEADLTVAQSTNNEYIIVLEHEGEVLTFISTSESEGVISIESIDDELTWAYSGEIKIVNEELQLVYGYRNINGSELPAFSSEGLFIKE